MQVNAILFDKDGTLFDFHATWSVWALQAISHLSNGNGAMIKALETAMHFDRISEKLGPTSPVIALTATQVEDIIVAVLPKREMAAARDYLAQTAAAVPIVPVVPLGPCLQGLISRGLALGVMTNDTEYCARAHLGKAGVEHLFQFIAGFDSGFGAKPDPAPLLAFARAVEVEPQTVVMVGDSVHDLTAGRAAGMRTVAVLTGVAVARDLAPHADVVLPNIGGLNDWLEKGSLAAIV